MTDRELMQQALEALIKAHPYSNSNKDLDGHSEAIAALRSRLAQPEHIIQTNDGRARINSLTGDFGIGTPSQPEQEPVAWEDVLGAIARGWTHDDNKHKTMDVQLAVAIAKEIQDMVIAPPQRKPLKLREIEKCIYDANNDPIVACRNVEAAHGIKENT
jgi:hypothetical protein